jgi:hypothetical protein
VRQQRSYAVQEDSAVEHDRAVIAIQRVRRTAPEEGEL